MVITRGKECIYRALYALTAPGPLSQLGDIGPSTRRHLLAALCVGSILTGCAAGVTSNSELDAAEKSTTDQLAFVNPSVVLTIVAMILEIETGAATDIDSLRDILQRLQGHGSLRTIVSGLDSLPNRQPSDIVHMLWVAAHRHVEDTAALESAIQRSDWSAVRRLSAEIYARARANDTVVAAAGVNTDGSIVESYVENTDYGWLLGMDAGGGSGRSGIRWWNRQNNCEPFRNLDRTQRTAAGNLLLQEIVNVVRFAVQMSTATGPNALHNACVITRGALAQMAGIDLRVYLPNQISLHLNLTDVNGTFTPRITHFSRGNSIGHGTMNHTIELAPGLCIRFQPDHFFPRNERSWNAFRSQIRALCGDLPAFR